MCSKMTISQADFSLNFLRNNGGSTKTTIFSPLSISTAMAMVYLGAKGKTAEEIKNVFGNGVENDEEIHKYFSSFLNYISSNNLGEIILESANRIYLKEGFTLLDTFVNGIKHYYRGEIELVDFLKSDVVASNINQFVAKCTHNKIQDIVTSDSFDKVTRLVLINAIYFKGKWQNQFDKWCTRDANFYSSQNSTKTVKMMSLDEKRLPYYEDKDCQILGLPYKGYEFTMYILLPREKYGLQNLIDTINSEPLIQILSKRAVSLVKVKLPQFKIESTFDVKNTLQKLGINDAFSDADFTGISVQEPIFISDVKHKAFIEVNEEGTEAAAATVVTGMFGCSRRQEFKEFIANHPFLFFIADRHFNFFFVGTHF